MGTSIPEIRVSDSDLSKLASEAAFSDCGHQGPEAKRYDEKILLALEVACREYPLGYGKDDDTEEDYKAHKDILVPHGHLSG